MSAARLAGFLYSAGGVLVMTSVWMLSDETVRRGNLVTVGAIALLSGLIVPRMPWERWHPQAILWLTPLTFTLLGIVNHGVAGPLGPYRALYVLVFAYLGLTQPPWSLYVCLALASISWILPELGEPNVALAWASLVVAIPVWFLVYEILHRTVLRLRRTELTSRRLLEASTALAATDTQREAADVLAELAVDLLDADCSVVMVGAEEGSAGFVNAGQRNFNTPLGEAFADFGTQVLKTRPDERLSLIVDADRSELVPKAIKQGMSCRSMFFITLEEEDLVLGVLVAGWGERRVDLSLFETRAIDLLKREAGVALGRLQATMLLETQAGTDVLTGLANRRVFQQALSGLHPGDAVVMVDLDHFKTVNDRYGHVVGDDVLKSLADCMSQIGRKSDTIARYGGEEFALVLKGAEFAGADSALQRLTRLWATTNPLTTFSAGVAINQAEDPPAVTLERADAALYRAKQMGRNRVEHADEDVKQETENSV